MMSGKQQIIIRPMWNGDGTILQRHLDFSKPDVEEAFNYIRTLWLDPLQFIMLMTSGPDLVVNQFLDSMETMKKEANNLFYQEKWKDALIAYTELNNIYRSFETRNVPYWYKIQESRQGALLQARLVSNITAVHIKLQLTSNALADCREVINIAKKKIRFASTDFFNLMTKAYSRGIDILKRENLFMEALELCKMAQEDCREDEQFKKLRNALEALNKDKKISNPIDEAILELVKIPVVNLDHRRRIHERLMEIRITSHMVDLTTALLFDLRNMVWQELLTTYAAKEWMVGVAHLDWLDALWPRVDQHYGSSSSLIDAQEEKGLHHILRAITLGILEDFDGLRKDITAACVVANPDTALRSILDFAEEIEQVTPAVGVVLLLIQEYAMNQRIKKTCNPDKMKEFDLTLIAFRELSDSMKKTIRKRRTSLFDYFGEVISSIHVEGYLKVFALHLLPINVDDTVLQKIKMICKPRGKLNAKTKAEVTLKLKKVMEELRLKKDIGNVSNPRVCLGLLLLNKLMLYLVYRAGKDSLGLVMPAYQLIDCWSSCSKYHRVLGCDHLSLLDDTLCDILRSVESKSHLLDSFKLVDNKKIMMTEFCSAVDFERMDYESDFYLSDDDILDQMAMIAESLEPAPTTSVKTKKRKKKKKKTPAVDASKSTNGSGSGDPLENLVSFYSQLRVTTPEESDDEVEGTSSLNIPPTNSTPNQTAQKPLVPEVPSVPVQPTVPSQKAPTPEIAGTSTSTANGTAENGVARKAKKETSKSSSGGSRFASLPVDDSGAAEKFTAKMNQAMNDLNQRVSPPPANPHINLPKESAPTSVNNVKAPSEANVASSQSHTSKSASPKPPVSKSDGVSSASSVASNPGKQSSKSKSGDVSNSTLYLGLASGGYPVETKTNPTQDATSGSEWKTPHPVKSSNPAAASQAKTRQTKERSVWERKITVLQELLSGHAPSHLTSSYEVYVACRYCYRTAYANTGEEAGFDSDLVHSCSHNFLIGRSKIMGGDWDLIRERQNTTFKGKFEPCFFVEQNGCQPKCHFGHNEAEIAFWNADRLGTVKIKDLRKALADALEKFEAENKPEPKQATPQKTPTKLPKATSGRRTNSEEFPLSLEYTYKLACDSCIQAAFKTGYVTLAAPPNHECAETILVLQQLGLAKIPAQPWLRIRERNIGQYNPRSYDLCRHQDKPSGCWHGDICRFTHSPAEKLLWDLDRSGEWLINDFITRNQREVEGPRAAVERLWKKLGGAFYDLCGECFLSNPRQITRQARLPGMCERGHPWQKLLVHSSNAGLFSPAAHKDDDGPLNLTQVRLSPRHPGLLTCPYLPNCAKLNQCPHAHSMIERDVWALERDVKAQWGEQNDARALLIEISESHPPPPTPSPAPSQSSSGEKVKPPTPKKTAAAKFPGGAGDTEMHVESKVKRADFNFPVEAYCAQCYARLKKFVARKPGSQYCSSPSESHAWIRPVYFPSKTTSVRSRQIRNPMTHRPNYWMCRDYEKSEKCPRANECHFAHTDIELAIWNWMGQNKVYDIEECMKCSSKAAPVPSQPKPTAPVASSAASNPPLQRTSAWSGNTPVDTPRSVQGFNAMDSGTHERQSMFYCDACARLLMGERQWTDHCTSRRHIANTQMDADRAWNYRPPVPDREPQLCVDHEKGQTCQYSHYASELNKCPYAHGRDELEEWQERLDYRRMRRRIERQQDLAEPLDRLLEDYQANREEAFTDVLPEISVTCMSDLAVTTSNKSCRHQWRFTVEFSKVHLNAIILMHHAHRTHFALTLPGQQERESSARSEDGDGDEGWRQMLTAEADDFDPTSGRVDFVVSFRSRVHGSFEQWLVFDCGQLPRLYRQLLVESAPEDVLARVRMARKELTPPQRWSKDTVDIVCYTSPETDLDDNLELVYPEPTAHTAVNQTSIDAPFTPDNYLSKLHRLLEMEELHRLKRVASYNLTVDLELSDKILTPNFTSAPRGQLFARVQLTENLTEDTDAGHLLLTSVSKAFVSPDFPDRWGHMPSQVYETLVVTKNVFSVEGRGRDYLFLCLSADCVQKLGWESGQRVRAEVQFQMNRSYFCRLHYALDQLPKTIEGRPIVFPNTALPRNIEGCPKVVSEYLNSEQLRIIRSVMSDLSSASSPLPLIVCGSFGSGKTKTLGVLVETLIVFKPTSKIIICTHTNTAADMYVTLFLDPLCKKLRARGLEFVPNVLRVYWQHRHAHPPRTQDESCLLQYALLSEDGTRYRQVTKRDLDNARVVVTTLETAVELSQMHDIGTGYFDYIFVDEAAQVLEAEVLIPLTLAGPRTRVVLAGDPMQMSPEVFSPEAGAGGLGETILDRLWRHYLYTNTKDARVLLCTVYRTNPIIVEFLSKAFYGGPGILTSKADALVPSRWLPLSLYYVYGKADENKERTIVGEILDEETGCWFNPAEAMKVCQQVEAVLNDWPDSWGSREEAQREVCVVSPYYRQVQIIRQQLRQKRLGHVVVERPGNVQGREFRVVFISPVRTRRKYLEADVGSAPGDHPNEGLGEEMVLEEPSGTFGYDFHTDKRMINTVMTRAKSIVQVVGDPLGLVLVGRCQNTWRDFIQFCGTRYSSSGILPLSERLSLEQIMYLENQLVDELTMRQRFQGKRSQQKNRVPSATPEVAQVSSEVAEERNRRLKHLKQQRELAEQEKREKSFEENVSPLQPVGPNGDVVATGGARKEENIEAVEQVDEHPLDYDADSDSSSETDNDAVPVGVGVETSLATDSNNQSANTADGVDEHVQSDDDDSDLCTDTVLPSGDDNVEEHPVDDNVEDDGEESASSDGNEEESESESSSSDADSSGNESNRDDAFLSYATQLPPTNEVLKTFFQQENMPFVDDKLNVQFTRNTDHAVLVTNNEIKDFQTVFPFEWYEPKEGEKKLRESDRYIRALLERDPASGLIYAIPCDPESNFVRIELTDDSRAFALPGDEVVLWRKIDLEQLQRERGRVVSILRDRGSRHLKEQEILCNVDRENYGRMIPVEDIGLPKIYCLVPSNRVKILKFMVLYYDPENKEPKPIPRPSEFCFRVRFLNIHAGSGRALGIVVGTTTTPLTKSPLMRLGFLPIRDIELSGSEHPWEADTDRVDETGFETYALREKKGDPVDLAFSLISDSSPPQLHIHLLDVAALLSVQRKINEDEIFRRGQLPNCLKGGIVYPRKWARKNGFGRSAVRPAITIRLFVRLDRLAEGCSHPIRDEGSRKNGIVSWSLDDIILSRVRLSSVKTFAKVEKLLSSTSGDKDETLEFFRDAAVDWAWTESGFGALLSAGSIGRLIERSMRRTAEVAATQWLSKGDCLPLAYPLAGEKLVNGNEMAIWRISHASVVRSHPKLGKMFRGRMDKQCRCSPGDCNCTESIGEMSFTVFINDKAFPLLLRGFHDRDPATVLPLLTNPNICSQLIFAQHEYTEARLKIGVESVHKLFVEVEDTAGAGAEAAGGAGSQRSYAPPPNTRLPIGNPLKKGICLLAMQCVHGLLRNREAEGSQNTIHAPGKDKTLLACDQAANARRRMLRYRELSSIQQFEGGLYRVIFYTARTVRNNGLHFLVSSTVSPDPFHFLVDLEDLGSGSELVDVQDNTVGETETVISVKSQRIIWLKMACAKPSSGGYKAVHVPKISVAANHSYVYRLMPFMWAEILNSGLRCLVNGGRRDDLNETDLGIDIVRLESSQIKMEPPVPDNGLLTDSLELAITPGAVLSARLSQANDGSRLVADTLWITDYLPVCLHHRREPEKLFIDYERLDMINSTELRQVRETLVRSTCTDPGRLSVRLMDVPIVWNRDEVTGEIVEGTVQIPNSLLDSPYNLREFFEEDDMLTDYTGLFCIHLVMERSDGETELPGNVEWPACFIVHGLLKHYDRVGDNLWPLVEVTHVDGKLPTYFSEEGMRYSVEWIAVPLEKRIHEDAIRMPASRVNNNMCRLLIDQFYRRLLIRKEVYKVRNISHPPALDTLPTYQNQFLMSCMRNNVECVPVGSSDIDSVALFLSHVVYQLQHQLKQSILFLSESLPVVDKVYDTLKKTYLEVLNRTLTDKCASEGEVAVLIGDTKWPGTTGWETWFKADAVVVYATSIQCRTGVLKALRMFSDATRLVVVCPPSLQLVRVVDESDMETSVDVDQDCE